MAKLLVVDDSKVDQQLAGAILQRRGGWSVAYADNGRDALEQIAAEPPVLVLTDLQMPEMNGLELVEAVRRDHPGVPVVLVTAHGSEDIAAEALRRGAASYVPKRHLARDLGEIIDRVIAGVGAHRQQDVALECLTESESRFVLDNRTERIRPLIGYLRDEIMRLDLCDGSALLQVGVALVEALTNAMHHGNLELDSSLREADADAYYALAHERAITPPYSERRVHFSAKMSHEGGEFVVRDEGKGFDPTTLPDPTDAANIIKATGRGLLLIRTFMDEVRHSESGTQITMIKRCPA